MEGDQTRLLPLKGSIIKLLVFEAENYLEYLCQISLS